jgi:hypothetical protein
LATLPRPPTTGIPSNSLSPSGPRRDDRQAVVRLPAQLGREIGDDPGVADGDHPAHAAAQAAHPVQPLPQREPCQQVEHGQAGQRDDHVTAGDVGLRRVGQDRDGGGQRHARVQHPAELVRADPDEAGVIAARERHDAQPDQRQGEAEREVQARRLGSAVEPQLECQQPARESAEPVHDYYLAQVCARPDRGLLRGQACDYLVSPPMARNG